MPETPTTDSSCLLAFELHLIVIENASASLHASKTSFALIHTLGSRLSFATFEDDGEFAMATCQQHGPALVAFKTGRRTLSVEELATWM